MRYLLDTSTVSALARSRPPAGLERRIDLHGGQYAIASLVVAELRFGAQRHPDPVRRERLTAFVDGVVLSTPVVPFDARAGEWLGVERARLELAGTPVDLADLIIAATAAVNQLVVVTVNMRHFERMHVTVEDWTAP
ncbi:MAG: PIN domain-containing protein [Deltaproteobacteria bacterium]|nr:PIN domain-containing protein [Deltaproteobacteria bacterium]